MDYSFNIKRKILSAFMVVFMFLGLFSSFASAEAIMGPGNLTSYRGKTNQTFQFIVTGSTTGTVWGDGIYTDDSNLAASAVHAGVLSPGQQGVVTVKILPGQSSYSAATRNGVASRSYGSWSGSYQFIGSATQPGDTILANPGTLSSFRGKINQTFRFSVTGSTTGTIWGDGIYTDDSNLAASAVHAGVLSPGQQGVVTVKILPGQSSYSAATRNGVASRSYGSWPGSYQFVGQTVPSTETLRGTGLADGIKLEWDRSTQSGVVGYNLYRGTSSRNYSSTPVTDFYIQGLNYTDNTVLPDRTYYYVMKPVFSNGTEGSASNEVAVRVSSTQTLVLRGTGLLDGIKLDWDRSTQSGVVGYNLYRGTSSGNYSSTPVTDFYIREFTYTDNTVLPDRTYYYIMKPVFSNGTEGAASNEVAVRRIATPAVENRLTLQINNPFMTVRGVRQEIDPGRGTAPVIVNGRTLLPIRAVVEGMGGTIAWDGVARKVTIREGSNTVELWINSRTAYVNGVARELDVPAQIINDRTMVPFRFVGEALGKDIGWDGATRTVTMKLN